MILNSDFIVRVLKFQIDVIVILEGSKNVSSYLIDEPEYLKKVLKEYNKYKKIS